MAVLFQWPAGAYLQSSVLAALLAGAVALAESNPSPAADREEPDPAPRVVLPDESMYTASPADGGGSVTVVPAFVRTGAPCTLTFTYTVGPKGIQPGGAVLCYVTRFWHWAPPQNVAPDRPGFSTVSCSNPEARLAVEIDPGTQTVMARVEEAPLAEGDRLIFVYGDTSDGRYPQARGVADRFAEHDERFCFKVDGDGDGWFTAVARQATFDVRAGPAVRYAVFGPSRAAVGEPFELRVSALDAANNLVEDHVGPIALQYDGESLRAPAEAVFAPADRGTLGIEILPRRPGPTRLGVRDPRGRLPEEFSNLIVLHEPGPEKYRLVWADLQIHGNASDGTGTATDLYRYARDVARLDAAAVTEHDHWGYLPLSQHKNVWRSILETTDRFNEDGRFVAFPGYEWTNWTFGHQHVLFADSTEAVLLPWNDAEFDSPPKLWAALRGRDCITIPHHIGGDPIPTCWKYHDPLLQPVAEIVSIHGVSERMGQPGCIVHPEASGMAQAALARGYRLGMIGGGDTHDGHPGIGSPGAPPPGLAGIYTRDLTRKSILEALRARRAYATNGCRAILRFHSGSVSMGGVIRQADPDAPREFTIAVLGDAPVARVTIVKNNRDVAQFKGGGLVFTRTWRDPSPARSGDYYYVRISQVDGGWIWSSPIWVEVE